MAGASDAEKEIREAAIKWARIYMPSARVVHELNVAGMGTNRADLAFIEKAFLVLVEIKSEKDSLCRLTEQLAAFIPSSHRTVIIAHEKHFREDSVWRLDYRHKWITPDTYYEWRYPRQIGDETGWQIDRGTLKHPYTEPGAATFLEMLWREELIYEALRHNICLPKRPVRQQIIAAMVYDMKGHEITAAVCRQLRQRKFAEADEPIWEKT